MLGREGAQRVPRDLGVVMAVVVDKAGGDGASFGVDRARCSAAQLADVDDLAALDADIAAKRRHPRAIDDQSVPDQQIIRHRFLPPRPGLPLATLSSPMECTASSGGDTPCLCGKL